MRVVLDTNVLVRAAIAWSEGRSTRNRWLVEVALIAQRRYENVTSDPLMYELRSALQRIARLNDAFNDDFVEALSRASTFVTIYDVPMGVRDPRDDKVVETAMNANVDAIVSEDNDLHDVNARRAIAKTGIGIRDRPILVWKSPALVEALNDRPRFSPLLLPATLAA